jgi:hypothetical protein
MRQLLQSLDFASEARGVALLQDRYQAEQMRFRDPLHVVRLLRYRAEFVGQRQSFMSQVRTRNGGVSCRQSVRESPRLI